MLCGHVSLCVSGQVSKFCGIVGHRVVALFQGLGLKGPFMHLIYVLKNLGRCPNKGFKLIEERI